MMWLQIASHMLPLQLFPDFLFALTCKNPGLSRVFVNFKVSAVLDGVIFSDLHSTLYFYRNCTMESEWKTGLPLFPSPSNGSFPPFFSYR
jgi:hypothetical protein